MGITPNDPANFTHNRGSYKKLSPFRFWCQKVLPLVYDDSLSYYELLNKVINYLNMAMEDITTLEGDVTNLHTAYVQLQTYVNDYFVSLDVQEEINNKLDEMASDGTLTALISPLVPDIISEWLDEHITPTTPAIDDTLLVDGAGADSKTVGLNLGSYYRNKAYSVGEYCIKDGKLYCCVKPVSQGSEWNVENWILTNISEDLSIDVKSISNITGYENTFEYKWFENTTIVEADGTTRSSETYHATDFIEIPENQSVLMRTVDLSLFANTHNAFYDENKNFLSGFHYTINGDIVLNVPVTAKYIRVSCHKNVLISIIPWYKYNIVDRIDDSRDIIRGYHEFKQRISEGKMLNLLDIDGLIIDGYIKGQNGVFDKGTSASGLDKCTDFIPVKPDKVYIFLNNVTTKYNVAEYDNNFNFIGANYKENAYFKFNLNSETAFVRFSFNSSVEGYENSFFYCPDDIKDITNQKVLWRNGSATNINNNNAIAFRWIEPRLYANRLSIVVTEPLELGYKYRYQINTYNVCNVITEGNGNNRVTYDYTVITDKNHITFEFNDESIGFCVALYMLNDAGESVPLRYTTFNTDSIHIIREYDSFPENFKNYAVDSNFTKIPVTIDKIGVVNGVQAFCFYNNKYYSTDGSALYEQDDSFNLLSTTSLNLGHGNSMQLGNNGIAYVSGWDDQNIYCVNLESKSITDVITLPTTGYTTAVVDDLNNVVYIFQRDSRPNTNEIYNFIAYDYVNESILYTKKTSISFGGLQGCDFINGKIFAINGLGSTSVPNGYRVYNTNGDILSEYVIGRFKGAEPECVFVKRDTFEVYFSYIDGSVYKITNII